METEGELLRSELEKKKVGGVTRLSCNLSYSD